MTELLEKMSYEARQRIIEATVIQATADPFRPDKEQWKEVMELIAKEVELAYRAGMLHFNALDHTCLDTIQVESLDIDNIPWAHNQDWDPAGPVKPDLLISLYLQEKGFK